MMGPGFGEAIGRGLTTLIMLIAVLCFGMGACGYWACSTFGSKYTVKIEKRE